MGMGGGETSKAPKRHGIFTVSDSLQTSQLVVYEHGVKVWEGPIRVGPFRLRDVQQDLEKRKRHDENNRTT